MGRSRSQYHNTNICGYGSLRSQGRQRYGGNTVISGHTLFHRAAFSAYFVAEKFGPGLGRTIISAPRSMHRSEKPRETETGHPGPYRLVPDAEIP